MSIKAIETRYKGYRFRSRLEARWAVFFDAMGVAWEYEKEGFEMDGERLAELRDNSIHSSNAQFYKVALEWWKKMGSPSPGQASKKALEFIDAEQDWLRRYDELWESLASLDQLYIAV